MYLAPLAEQHLPEQNVPNHVSEPPAVDEASSTGKLAARLLVSTPLAL